MILANQKYETVFSCCILIVHVVIGCPLATITNQITREIRKSNWGEHWIRVSELETEIFYSSSYPPKIQIGKIPDRCCLNFKCEM